MFLTMDQKHRTSWCQWFMHVNHYSGDRDQEIMVRSQPGKIVHETQKFVETLSQKNPLQKKGTDGVAQGVGLEFKPLYQKKKKNKTKGMKETSKRWEN
jgi:hypothetical protein